MIYYFNYNIVNKTKIRKKQDNKISIVSINNMEYEVFTRNGSELIKPLKEIKEYTEKELSLVSDKVLSARLELKAINNNDYKLSILNINNETSELSSIIYKNVFLTKKLKRVNDLLRECERYPNASFDLDFDMLEWRYPTRINV